MTDVLSKKQRSYVMSRIKSSKTGPEMIVKKELVKNGIKGFRMGVTVEGNPDFVNKKKKIAVFIDGCFWHKCPKHFRMPKTNKTFWLKKIDSNVKRDRNINRKLKKYNWKVIRFWEHEVENGNIDFERLKTK